MTTGEISHGGTAIPGWLRTTETSAQLSSGSARVLAIGLASAMISLGVWLLISSPEQAVVWYLAELAKAKQWRDYDGGMYHFTPTHLDKQGCAPKNVVKVKRREAF